MTIGYSLALFSVDGSNKLRQYAVKADEKGNNNGLLDGDEVNEFKQQIKNRCGYEFDFSEIKEAEKKNINVMKFENVTEIARQYKASTTKIIDALNPAAAKREKNPYGEVMINNYTREHGINIAYMSEDDFKSSKKSIELQEDKYIKARDTIDDANTKLRESGLDKYYHLELDGNTIRIFVNESVTRSRNEVIEDFGFSPENVRKDEYKEGARLSIPVNEFSPNKERNWLQKFLGI